MEATVQEKQQYLKQQILESGLDGMNFMQYMGEIKNEKESINLQNWSMEELKNVVIAYKKQLKPKISQEDTQKQVVAIMSKQLAKSIILDQKQRKKIIVAYERDNLDDFQLKISQNCKHLIARIDLAKSPKIDYILFEARKSGGFFFGIGAKDQLWINLVTNFTQQKVFRKNEDFEWLRHTLTMQAVGRYVPPLQQMPSFEPQDKGMQMKRVVKIIYFMNNLLNFDYLAQNELLWKFLTISEPLSFNKLKSVYEQNKYKIDIKNIQTTQGVIEPEISTRMLKLIKKSSLFAQKSKEKYESINNNIFKILGDMQSLSKHTQYVANDFANLYQLFNSLGQKQVNQNSQTSTTFLYLNNLLSQYNKCTKEHINIIKETMNDFIKPIEDQWAEFTNFQKKRTAQLNDYLNKKLTLIKKKEKCYEDPLKWEIPQQMYDKLKKMNFNIKKEEAFEMMFPKENQAENQMKIWQGLLNCMYENSFNLLIEAQQKKYMFYLNKYIDRAQKIKKQEISCLESFREILISVK